MLQRSAYLQDPVRLLDFFFFFLVFRLLLAEKEDEKKCFYLFTVNYRPDKRECCHDRLKDEKKKGGSRNHMQ